MEWDPLNLVIRADDLEAMPLLARKLEFLKTHSNFFRREPVFKANFKLALAEFWIPANSVKKILDRFHRTKKLQSGP